MSEKIKPYGERESKKDQVRTMFNTIASRYDFLNRFLSLGIDVSWRKKAVREVVACSPNDILDLATGTGDLAIMMAKKLPDVAITGGDLSVNMLCQADTKAKKENLNIDFVECDADNLPFDDESFDAVTVAFGVRNFENIERGMSEILRVLKSGGKVFILEFSMPRSKFVRVFYRFYFKRVLPFVGGIISGDSKAYTYLPESVEAFPYGNKFLQIMKNVGYEESKSEDLSMGIAQLYIGVKK